MSVFVSHDNVGMNDWDVQGLIPVFLVPKVGPLIKVGFGRRGLLWPMVPLPHQEEHAITPV